MRPPGSCALPRRSHPVPSNFPWSGIYGTTKAATHSLSDALWMELAPLGIAVVLASTGAVRTNIAANQAASFAGLPEDSLYARFAPDVRASLGVSQGASAMPAREYARRLVRRTLVPRPPRYVLLGGETWRYPILQWLPKTFVLWLFWMSFTKLSRAG